jgi:putative ABC transport system ATP-binding protein
MSPSSISVRGARKVYRTESEHGVTAVDGVDLEVAEGELIAFMGPSGSGKSTLLNLLGGLDVPTRGSVRVAGREISAMEEKELARFRFDSIGFVFQHFHLMPNFTVAENIALTALIAHRPRSQWLGRVVELLTAVGLADRIDALPHTLSGGEQQRVAVCRAIFARPPVLLADEPTGNLDSRSSAEVLRLIRRAVTTEPGASGLLVTHDLEAAVIADRILLLRDGRIAGEFAPDRGEGTGRGERGEAGRADRIRAWLEASSG